MAVIMHVDLNAFFATAETLRDPSLKGKPLIIGHAGRSGIVSTCSYEARKYGVHSGQPTFQALKLCPQAIIVEPHFSYYHVLSESFFSLIRQITPLIEVASVDECYADMSKVLTRGVDPIAYCHDLQQKLFKEMGLPCSIGIAPTKWMAKMGSDLKKPMGVTIIRKKDIEKILYPLPIESFWGIGKKTSPRLRELGILTIGDFAAKAKADDPNLMKLLGKFYFTAKTWVLGGGDNVIDTNPFDPKSVGVSTTLPRDCQGLEEVEPFLINVCNELSTRAKKERKKGYTVTLQVKDTSFKTHSKRATLLNSTNDEDVIFIEAKRLYKAFYEKMDVRLIGVTLEKLVDPKKEEVQMSLWNYEEYEKMDKTKLLIEDLNRKMDKPKLMRLSQIKKDGTQ